MVVPDLPEPARARPGVDPLVADAVTRIRAWGEARDWRGYDPYDALNSPFAGLLSLRTLLGRRLLTQAVKLSPLNLRPLLRIPRAHNAKAVGLVASGYARLAAALDDDAARTAAAHWLTWLLEHDVGAGVGRAWGYHFPVATRVFEYPRDAANTIATSFVAQAFLDAAELLGEERWLDAARAATDHLCERMLTEDADGPYFSYVAGERELVHNANMLAAAVLVRTGRLAGDPALVERAADAVETTVGAQREDGSWPYAVGPGHGWVDNFHTAYVLESLAECAKALPGLRAPLERGLAYWSRELFLPDGTPKYWSDRVYPLDAHAYADAVEAWVAVGRVEEADRQARLLVERMLDRRGYVHVQRWPWFTNRVAVVRWSTAPAFRSLAGLLLLARRAAAAQA